MSLAPNTIKSPLCILSVIPGERSGNSMIFAKRQVESLRELGVKNHIFFLASRTRPLELLRETKRLKNEIVKIRPDIIHAHYGTITAMLCALVTSVPLIITFRGSDLNPSTHVSRLRSFIGILFSQLATLRARKIICVSSQLKQRLWWRQNIVTVLPTGVDTNVFYPRNISECRRDLGWDESERVVVFNAGKSPLNKRLDLAQAAVESARSVCGDIRFYILDGSTMPSMVPVLLNAANCLVVTSEQEGSPNIVKESLACNLPVVSVDVGDVKERLRGVFPSAIAERNADDIARLVLNIITKPARSNGHTSIDDISQVNIARKMLSLYLSCKY